MRTILISAYGCEPFVGSEAGVGWNWVLQMGKSNQLYVITRKNNKEKIENNLPLELRDNIQFYYYDAPNFIRKLKKRDKGLYFYYYVWQLGIIKIVRQIIKNHIIDYTMHLSFGSFWMPTFLPLFKVPFIWGPLGGGDCVPKSFLKVLPLKQRIIQYFRYFLKWSSFANPLVVFPAKKAQVILARTEDSAQTVPRRYQAKVKVVLETAMSDDVFDIVPRGAKKEKFELMYAGRLIPIKNVISLVQVIKQIPSQYNVHLTIVGRGSEKGKLLSYVTEHGLEQKVSFVDEMPRQEVLNMLGEVDTYLFPSLHEGGSWALMEAMAAGLPVICLDCTGMHTITTEDSAIRIQPTGPEIFVETMAREICHLIEDTEFRKSIGQKAKQRIWNDFRWHDKGLFMEKLFSEIEKTSNL